MIWLSKLFSKAPDSTDRSALLKAVSIDGSGPDFADVYPDRNTIFEAILGTECFKSRDIEWMTDIAAPLMSGGVSFKAAVRDITRAGILLHRDALEDLRLNTRRKIGDRFIEALSDREPEYAIEALDVALHTASSQTLQLHQLHRMQRLGIHFCKFLGPGEGANLPLESELSGKRMSIDEALHIVMTRPVDIRRSRFNPEVKF